MNAHVKSSKLKYYLIHYRKLFRSKLKDLYYYIINKIDRKKLIKLFETKQEQIFIKTLHLQVANICNANCIYCAYQFVKHKTGVMDFNIFKNAVDQFTELGGDIISLTPTIGEPLIDPAILRKIEYASSKKNIRNLYFYSNGLLLDKNDNYKKIVDSGIHEIDISMGDCEKSNYYKVFRSHAYEKVISGIHNLLKYNKQSGEKIRIKLNFRTIANPRQLTHYKDFKKYISGFLSKKVRYTVMHYYDNWGGTIKKENLLGYMKIKKPEKNKKLPCWRTFSASILYDGTVRLCGCRFKTSEYDDLVVGNIMKNSLKSIIFSEKTKTIRKNFIYGKLPEACIDCSFYFPITLKVLNGIM